MEQDVHRPANAHFALNRQVLVLCHQRIATIRTDQIFRPYRYLFARQPVQTGCRHTVVVLGMAQVLRAHPSLRAPFAGSGEEQRFHKGLRQVIHECGAAQQVLCLGERMRPP